MNCGDVRANLLAYLDGQVTAAERAQIEAHLAACQDCAAELARLRVLRADLRDALPAGLARLDLPRAAEARIRARLQRAQARRGRLGRLAGRWQPRPVFLKAAIPLVVAFFLAFAGLIVTLPAPVSAQETLVLGPATFTPDTDAALRVIVRDYASAEPISNAEVVVRMLAQGEDEAVLLYTGRTGRQGTADVRFHVPFYEQDALSARLIVTTASSWGQDEIAQQITLRRSFRVYLTSDKPLYQPGQTVHLRVLALEAATGLPAVARQVTFTVESPDGQSLLTETLFASDYGIAATDCSLPADAPHGAYRLTATLGDTISERTVTVGRYERPRFQVGLSVARSYYLPGEVVNGQVTARFFHGQPLPGATVELRATLADPEQRLVSTVQGRTDATGTFTFGFGLPFDLRAAQASLALEASVADETGHVEWAGRVLPVAVEPLAVDVVAEGGRLRPGVENVVYLLTTTPDGAPVPAQLTLDVAGQAQTLSTNAFGLAEFRLLLDSGVRDVPLRVTARDAQGRETMHTVILSADQGPAQVLLRLDRAVYEVGETMHLQVLAGQGDVVYLDVVRQGQTLSTHVADLRAGRAGLALDVSPDMVGTLQLNAYQVLPDGTLAHDARLAVVGAPDQVTVDVQPAETTFRAGGLARVAIATRLDDAPVQSALGIAVVDESVFALEDRAPGFAKLFFLLEASQLDPAARPAGVTLADLLAPPAEAELRAAQDLAARAAWVGLPLEGLALERSSHVQAAAVAGAEMRDRLRGLGLGLAAALLGIPLALWGVVVGRLRRAGSLRPALWRKAAALIGVNFVLGVPAVVLVVLGLFLLWGAAPGKALLVALLLAWLAALLGLGAHAWRRRDDGAQIVILLVAAYAVLGALMGYVAERGGDPGLGLGLGIAVTFLAALAALLLLAAGFWLERQRGAAGLVLTLVLLFVAIVVLAGAVLALSSPLAHTLGDPQLYAGPLGWLTGCMVATPETVEKLTTPLAEATAIVEVEPSPGASPTPEPQPTQQPTAPTPTPPPPLLSQLAPETIYWAPQAITGEDGRLEIEISLPETLTTWRLTVLASTRQGQLGAATAVLPVAR